MTISTTKPEDVGAPNGTHSREDTMAGQSKTAASAAHNDARRVETRQDAGVGMRALGIMLALCLTAIFGAEALGVPDKPKAIIFMVALFAFAFGGLATLGGEK